MVEKTMKRWVDGLIEKSSPVCCIVCEQPRHEGISILDEFICDDCERSIVRTPVEDKKYSFFVTQLSRIWLNLQGSTPGT
ncbi:sigma factor G inhibitor Gin [Planifilum fimeticola]|jgi:hypothetical protein|uniref:sigma factor G inhibitor Gin n=1 Tax=Planifilum fimeticola TaxID=201975 RepID=UPI003183D60F